MLVYCIHITFLWIRFNNIYAFLQHYNIFYSRLSTLFNINQCLQPVIYSYGMVNVFLFATTIILWIISWSLVRSSRKELFAPRLTWHQYDPTLLHEACFSLANVVAAGKLFYFFQYVESFGPLQVQLDFWMILF